METNTRVGCCRGQGPGSQWHLSVAVMEEGGGPCELCFQGGQQNAVVGEGVRQGGEGEPRGTEVTSIPLLPRCPSALGHFLEGWGERRTVAQTWGPKEGFSRRPWEEEEEEEPEVKSTLGGGG